MAKRRNHLQTLREEKRKRLEAEADELAKKNEKGTGGAGGGGGGRGGGRGGGGGGLVAVDHAADAEVAAAMVPPSSSSSSPPSGDAAAAAAAEAEASRLRFEALPPYTPHNYPEEYDVFSAIDADESGRVSGTELRCCLRRVGMEETAVKILSSLYNADTNGIYTKALNFAEFVEATQRCWATTRRRGGEKSLVAEMKAALEAAPKLKRGYWGDDEKFHQYVTGRSNRKPVLETDLWERAKRATLGDKRRNEILTELRSVHDGKKKRRRVVHIRPHPSTFLPPHSHTTTTQRVCYPSVGRCLPSHFYACACVYLSPPALKKEKNTFFAFSTP